MKKGKWIAVIMAAGMLVSCSTKHTVQESEQESVEETKEVESSQEITTLLLLSEEQKAQSHITGYLAENIIVDADLTPYEAYAEGLNTYYIETYREAEDVESYLANPTFFHQELDEVLSKLDIGFDKEKMTVLTWEMGVRYDIPAITEYSEKEKEFMFVFDVDSAGTVQMIELYFSNVGKDMFEDRIKGAEIIAQNPFYNREDLDFANGAELGEEMKELVEFLTGYELSDSYVCIPVTTENRAFSGEAVEEEFYTYVYHWSVDGFPWRMLQLYMTDYGDAELAEDVSISESGLGAKESWNVMVLCSKDGIIYMEIPKYYCLGEQYQQNKAICDVNIVLENAKKYLENRLAGNKVATIYEIELCYSGYFSDPADGIIQNAVMPFWVVRYCPGDWGFDIVFDGFTGAYIDVLQAD